MVLFAFDLASRPGDALEAPFVVYREPYYYPLNGGVPTLRISELVWQEGWPLSAEP